MVRKRTKKKWLIAIVVILILIIQGRYFWGSSTDGVNNQVDIELGEYKNLQVCQDDILITEQDLQEELNYRLMKYVEYEEVDKSRVEKGNIVTLVLANSQQVDNEYLEVRVGEREVSQEIDDALIGMIKNEEKEVKIDNIKYSLRVLEIKRVIYPKIDDKFVKRELGYDNVSEYMEYLQEEIYRIKLDMELEDVKEELLNMVVDNSEIYGCTNEKVSKRYEQLKASYESYAKLYQISYEDVLSQFDTNEQKMRQHVIQNIKQEIVVNAIMQSENVNLDMDEYRKREMDYIEDYGYNSIDQFIEDCGKEYLESEVNKQIVEDILYEKAIIN